jgi:hypothetical protein
MPRAPVEERRSSDEPFLPVSVGASTNIQKCINLVFPDNVRILCLYF